MKEDDAGGVWWCNSHRREATHVRDNGERCCDPKLSGILLPCFVVFAEIELVDDGKGDEKEKSEAK